MSQERLFPLCDVLSITTGHLVSTRHIDGVAALLNWMAGGSLPSQLLHLASAEARPLLLDRYPALSSDALRSDLDDLLGRMNDAAAEQHPFVLTRWLEGLTARFGRTLLVPRLGAAERDRLKAAKATTAFEGPDKVFPVVVS